MIPDLEPILTWKCDRTGCTYTIRDEHSITEEAREEHRAMHDRLARRHDRCSECTCLLDDRTPGCTRCRWRHNTRARKRRA